MGIRQNSLETSKDFDEILYETNQGFYMLKNLLNATPIKRLSREFFKWSDIIYKCAWKNIILIIMTYPRVS